MSIRPVLIAALVLGVAAVLVVEGYYVYRFYAEPSGATQTGASRTAAPEATAPGATGTGQYTGQPASFIHRATQENISANSTYLDSPLTNGNPDAIISVTQNWNPGGDSGTYNDHTVGVWYDSDRERWAIFNQDRAPMPEGATFNVTVSGKSAE